MRLLLLLLSLLAVCGGPNSGPRVLRKEGDLTALLCVEHQRERFMIFLGGKKGASKQGDSMCVLCFRPSFLPLDVVLHGNL